MNLKIFFRRKTATDFVTYYYAYIRTTS